MKVNGVASVRKLLGAAAAAAMLALTLGGCASNASSAASSASSAASSASAAASDSSASTSTASSAASSASAAASSSASASAASASGASSAASGQKLENGVYTATFSTDSSMFHVNEAEGGKGELTVTDDGMVIHVSLTSKKIVNLYAGLAKDAETDTANQIQPTTDKVKYSDGTEEEVYGFDIPVPALDEEFDVAILGEKGKWYDHKVSVSDAVAA